ncbi:hypothetical protein ACJJTC_009728 [Scirpophaga incertulas]
MYTLKGIFPEPKKAPKKNFIKENMKQLQYIQNKSPKEPKYTVKTGHPPRLSSVSATGNSLPAVKSSSSYKSAKVSLNVNTCPANARKKLGDVRIKKGDMAEFLKRKEQRLSVKPTDESPDDMEDAISTASSSNVRDMACQTIESNFAQKFADSTKLTVLYPRKEILESPKPKASGDMSSRRSPLHSNTPRHTNEDLLEGERNSSKLNSILEKKDKDPYLPTGYQKGVVPKYLRDRKEHAVKESESTKPDEDDSMCPPGHVALPDMERKETLRMLRNSFAELISELNKMPVKSDTLRMKNRKMELEKQLAKLEEGIKVFSRPKVYVKIGE